MLLLPFHESIVTIIQNKTSGANRFHFSTKKCSKKKMFEKRNFFMHHLSPVVKPFNARHEKIRGFFSTATSSFRRM
jgi:hypothetical protein